MADDSGRPPRSIFARSAELMGLAARIGQKEIGKRLGSALSSSPEKHIAQLKTQLDQAKLMVQSLGKLKGAAMKMGQMLSLEARDFLPKEVIDVLSQLQDQSPAMEISFVKSLLETELGAEKFAKLTDISTAPVASASIGQVHSAVLGGRKIALKIQYPGISDTIESDLKLLRNIVRTLLSLSQKRINIDELFSELQSVLINEADYLREGEQMQLFHKILDGRSGFVVPDFLPEYSTAHVLAMSFEQGQRIGDWLKTSPSFEDRIHFAQKVLDLYVIEFFESGVVQTDPNFANFLLRPETRELIVLDFGATRSYTQEFRSAYRRLLWLIRNGSDEEILNHSVRMDLLKDNESSACKSAYVKMLKLSTEPFNPKSQPFNFADLDYSRSVREATFAFTQLVEHSAPPHQLIFLHRKLGGVFALIKALNVAVDLAPYWKQLVEDKKAQP